MSETQVTTEVQFENTDDLDAFASGFFGQKQPETTETKVEVEQDNETQTSEETEAQVNDEQDEAELQQEVVETPKRKTVQDRIDEVVRQREDIRREGQNQVAELLKRIEQLEKGTKPEVQNQSTEQLVDPNEPKPDALKEDGSPVYALGEFDPQYIRDLTRHTLQQERQRMEVENAQAQRQAAVQQEQQALTNQWNTKLADAVKEYPDLEEKGRAMLSQFDNLDPNYAGYLTQVLMSMDKGPDVLY